jgi:hypothetical protein
MTEQILDELLAPPAEEPAPCPEVAAETITEEEVATFPAPPSHYPPYPRG